MSTTINAFDARKAAQTIFGVLPDGQWGAKTDAAASALKRAAPDAPWPPGLTLPAPPTGPGTNRIVDLNHSNGLNFDKFTDIAIIHKATQGDSFRDQEYRTRRTIAKMRGILWGAYHFSTGEDAVMQADNFLDFAQPDDTDLISLDWEPSPGNDMTLAQAEAFCRRVKERTGRFPVVYGGSLLREKIGDGTSEILAQCPLWHVIYRATPDLIVKKVWPKGYTLWQYTDGVNGRLPHATPGCNGADRNIYDGTEEKLREEWPFTRKS